MQIDITTSSVKPLRNTYAYIEKDLVINQLHVIKKRPTIFRKKLIFITNLYGSLNLIFTIRAVL